MPYIYYIDFDSFRMQYTMRIQSVYTALTRILLPYIHIIYQYNICRIYIILILIRLEQLFTLI